MRAPQLSYKRIADDGDVLNAARKRVGLIFDDFDRIVVSFSGGKDSTVVFNLAYEAALQRDRFPLDVAFYDEEAIAPDTVDYVRRIATLPGVNLSWYCLPVKHRNGATTGEAFWYPWDPEQETKWCRPLPPEAIQEIEGVNFADPESRPTIPELTPYITYPSDGRSAMMLGIRASESLTRLKSVSRINRAYPWLIPAKQDSSWVSLVYPVYDWKTSDVWTVPAMLGWDYNRFYDHLEMAGVPHDQQRCAPPYGDEPLRGLNIWQETYPHLWDKMVERVPGAAAAARYANTELYSAYSKLELEDGENPQTYVKSVILLHETEGMRVAAADKVRSMVKLHYSKTHEPLLLNARHPISGLSWRIITKMARTADLKNRSSANINPGFSFYDKLRKPYLIEWNRLAAEGKEWLPKMKVAEK